MKKVKRYLAVLLVTCLFISMLVPTETGAEETEAETIVSVSASSLKNNGYEKRFFFHISDEPDEKHLKNYEKLKIESIAFPALGCGNGDLSWKIVGPLIYRMLKDLPIDIEIYAPYGTPSYQLTKEFLGQKN